MSCEIRRKLTGYIESSIILQFFCIRQQYSKQLLPVTTTSTTTPNMLKQVSSELEALRCVPIHDGDQFPPACRSMLYSLPGNDRCVDCGVPGLHQWASISYGGLLCIICSGRHRSYGVQTSFVRSIDMDTWSHTQVLCMLEGGNEQLQRFFERHHMGTSLESRYMTKAALFYRSNLKRHVETVVAAGTYKGREATRRLHHQSKQAMHDVSVPSQKSKDRKASIHHHTTVAAVN